MAAVGRPGRLAPLALSLALLLPACGADVEQPEFERYDYKRARTRAQYGTVTGNDGFTLLSTDGRKGEQGGAGGGGGIGVNAYLWRATLDTIDFIPLASADPFGGVIISEWYQPTTNPGERLKVTVYIQSTELRADALKVAVFRQIREDGAWLDAPVDPDTATELENTILTRARELRIASAGS